MSRSRREPPTAAHLLEVVRDSLFTAPEWALFPEVRSNVGGEAEGLRVADGIAVRMRTGPLHFVGFETKRFREDWRTQKVDTSKTEETARYCAEFWIVVPAPAKDIVRVGELPRGVGLIEVAGPRAEKLAHAELRHAAPPPDGFLRALLRRAEAATVREQRGEGDAPAQPIACRYSREQLVLACDHLALVPLDKHLPRTVPCYACAAGLDPDPRAIAARLELLDVDKLEPVVAVLRERMPELFGPGLASGRATERADLAPLAAGVRHG